MLVLGDEVEMEVVLATGVRDSMEVLLLRRFERRRGPRIVELEDEPDFVGEEEDRSRACRCGDSFAEGLLGWRDRAR